METLDYEHYAEILKALGHPVRLRMAVGLLENECHVNRIVEKLDLPQSTVSQQLGILRSRGIIASRKEGVRTCYRVIDEDVRNILAVLIK